MNSENAIPSAARVHFELSTDGEDRPRLVLSGQMDTDSAQFLWRKLKHQVAATPFTTIDAAGLTQCDSAALGLLYFLSTGGMTPGASVNLTGLKPEFQHVLESFSLADYQRFQGQQPAKPAVPEDIGRWVLGAGSGLKEVVVFIGQVASGLVAVALHPRQLRAREMWRVFESAGVNALPLVMLISLLVGLIIAFEAAQPLAFLLHGYG